MAAAGRRGRGSTHNAYKWLGHIEVHFNDEERSEVIAHIGERTADFEDLLSRLTQKGIGVKFAYEIGKDCYRITLQPKDKNCYLRGYTLGYSHVELTRLILIGDYICEVMVENEMIEKPGNETANDW